jgi:hypothetical protein
MLTETNQDKRKYITMERNKRIKNCIRDMNVQINNEHVSRLMEELMENWINNGNNKHWDTIIDGIKMLPGTEEEKLIFLLGYMARVFLDELQEKENNDDGNR